MPTETTLAPETADALRAYFARTDAEVEAVISEGERLCAEIEALLERVRVGGA